MAITQNHVINIQPGVSAPLVIHCSQGDTGTVINLTVVNGDEEFDCSSYASYACSVHGVRSDGGNWGPYPVTVNGSTVSFPLRSTMTAISGPCLAEITVGTVGTANFAILVENATFGVGVTYTEDASVYQNILNYVMGAVQDIKAEATAGLNKAIDQMNANTNAVNAKYDAAIDQMNAKANDLQNQYDVTNAKLDTAISAATQDSEVQDIRVKADGTSATTAGNAVREQITELKNDIDKISSEYTFNLTWVDDEYVEVDGSIKTFNGWRRTNYIQLRGASNITITGTTATLKYNAFYDTDKKFISNFVVQNGAVISVPSEACYMMLSGGKAQTSSYIVKGRMKGIDSIRNVFFPLTKIKICSFNVGMWADGVSKGVPTDEVNAKSLALRRFLSNENADFLLCEEARKYFDIDNTILAYDENIKYNYPNYFRTDDTKLFYGTREMLIASNKNINNATIHNYKCESERQYITFNSTINNVTVTFILCHLSTEGNSTGIRQQEMEELAEFLGTCEYGILCGDFNAFSIAEFDTHFSAFNMANHGYFGDLETWVNDEYKQWNKCLDNIITTTNIKISQTYMGNIDMSDHKPLIAEVEIL